MKKQVFQTFGNSPHPQITKGAKKPIDCFFFLPLEDRCFFFRTSPFVSREKRGIRNFFPWKVQPQNPWESNEKLIFY